MHPGGNELVCDDITHTMPVHDVALKSYTCRVGTRVGGGMEGGVGWGVRGNEFRPSCTYFSCFPPHL